MRKIREVLRLKFEQRLSNRAVAASCRVGCATISEYLSRCKTAGLEWPLPPQITDEELEERLFPPGEKERDLPDWQHVHRELRRKGVTLRLLWEEYHAQHPGGYSYSHYCDLYRVFRAGAEPRMRQVHLAGEKLFVDYAGLTVPVVFDRKSGEVRDAQIFVATLGASNYTYAEATWTQGLEDWIGSHVRAFAFFGGVPRVVVPDNLKAGVKSPHRYEPDINLTYLDLARHYHVAIVPARVVKPRDKAKVETHVQIVERQILARLRNRRFLSLFELNDAVWDLLERLNDLPFQKLEGTRRKLFLDIDAPLLCPLPQQRYELATWKKARVNIDYHVEVDRRYYSVPYTLIHKKVDVRQTARIVEILYNGERVASHLRLPGTGHYATEPQHMPPNHQAQAEWTPQRIAGWAQQTGGATEQAVRMILGRHEHPQQAFRACLGIMRLGQRHGADRLEAACARMVAAGYPTYKNIQAVLVRGLDGAASPAHAQSRPTAPHANIRGPGYYADPALPPQRRQESQTHLDLTLCQDPGEHHA